MVIAKKDEYTISTRKEDLNISYIHRFLTTSYWAEGIPVETVKRSIDGSLCFGVYHQNTQVGFARIISDLATYAYLADVFIDPQQQGRGLGKWLVGVILKHPDLQGLRRIELGTLDAHGLYAQFGFVPLPQPERFMQIRNPDVYKQSGKSSSAD
ncbi:GNAT family N-acetyltransferase [Paraflavitalea sp. CAU 1676]|uniref:GNAT family N-acetyltransferase n=1 Tax=Paraflavitalea sp. CAU 1676 TaxID=3032598 RepID=UPI0023DCD9BB|nr:GNAT family N-acetyltransferase [Paraflavitalea sp. CAU 1676]MDF2187122.1 GNAT family N-acetyltransferase [Paraflavitalea sp. CAU 1676]